MVKTSVVADYKLFTHESASLCLTLWTGESRATVSSLFASERGLGHGSALMQKLVQYADENDLTLILSAQPDSPKYGLKLPQLIKFYEKFGFQILERDETGAIMERPLAK